MRRFTLALSVVLVAATSSEAQVLKGDELKAAVVGKSGAFKSKDGKLSGSVSYSADGQANVKGNFKGFSEDSGTWRFNAGKFCVKWKKIRKGKEACFTPERLADGSLDFGNLVAKLN